MSEREKVYQKMKQAHLVSLQVAKTEALATALNEKLFKILNEVFDIIEATEKKKKEKPFYIDCP